jgi:hypothetical protein
LNLNFSGAMGSLGYGVAARNIFHQLVLQKNKVALWPIGGIEQNLPSSHIDSIKEGLYNQGLYDSKAPSILLWHQHSLQGHVGKGLHIGFPVFELDNFTQREIHHLSQQDMIFVCSHWAKNIIDSKINSCPCHVIPLGVDTDIFYPNSLDFKKTIFLNVGKWTINKGHDILIRAFLKAFTYKDDVELWVVPNNPFLTPIEESSWITRYKSNPLANKITIFPRFDNQEKLANLMRAATCGIYPIRCEGWNLEILELFACGKPVITTNYSGQTEFCNPSNSFLVNINEVEPAHDGKWFHGEGNWAKIENNEIDVFVEHMRYIHKNNIHTNPNGLETAKQFSWKNSAQKIIGKL